MSDPTGPSEPRARGWLALRAGLLPAIVLAVYLPAVPYQFVWDDDDHVVESEPLRDLEGLRDIWLRPGATQQYYPVVHTAFWIQYQLWGLWPEGYHLVNIFLHALAAVLLWLVLRRLRIPGNWLAAAVFAVHPVHVESVAWITELKNVLSLCFYLAALHLYLGSDEGRRRKRYWGALALFVGALSSKTVTCTLPVVIVLLTLWRRPSSERQLKRFLPLIPFFALGLVAGLHTVVLERGLVGAAGAEWDYTLVERGLIAGRALWFYMVKLLWPAPIIFIYPFWSIDSGDWVQYLWPASFLALIAACWWLRRSIGRGPIVALACFAVTLFPALGFFNVFAHRYSFVADHFQYHASICFTTLVVAMLTLGGRRLGLRLDRLDGDARPRVAGIRKQAVVPVALLLSLGLLSARALPKYADAETLFRDTLRRNPTAWMAHNNLGIVLWERDDLPEAEEHFRAAVRLKRDQTGLDHAGAINNLARTLDDRGKIAEARTHYERAIELQPRNPKMLAHYGRFLTNQGETERAAKLIRRAIELAPGHGELWFNLGTCYARGRRLEEARDAYQRALELAPRDASARYHLALVHAELGEPEQSVVHLRAVLAEEPTHERALLLLERLRAVDADAAPVE